MIRTCLVAQRQTNLFLLGGFLFNFPLRSVFNPGGKRFAMTPPCAWPMAS